MADLQEPWKNLASKAEALGLKLKLHLEQEADETEDETTTGETTAGETKAAIEDLGRRLQDAFDSLGAAVKDPAVRADMKDMGSLFKEALTDTFSTVSTDVGDAMRKATKRGDGGAGSGDATDGASGTVDDVVDDTGGTESS